MQIIDAVHPIAVTLFVCATAYLLIDAIIYRLRVRHVRLSWAPELPGAIPVLPSLVLVCVLSLVTYGLAVNFSFNSFLIIGYLCGASFWFASALLSQVVIVTDYAMILKSGRKRKALGWGEIGDYFISSTKRGLKYAFFYNDMSGRRNRMNLTVPDPLRQQFNRIVYKKIDARFDFHVKQTYGKKALND